MVTVTKRRRGPGPGYEGDGAERSPWRRPGFILSGVLVAGLVIVALLLLLTPPGDAEPATSAPAPVTAGPPETQSAPPSSAEPDSAAAAASICGLEPGLQTAPTSPPGADWQLVGTTATPSDPDGAGPGVSTEDGFHSCFSHDPTGALFAGINWWAQGFNGRSVQVYEELTAATPERDAGLEQGLDESVTGVGQVAGFRFIDVEADRVVFELAINTPAGDLASLPTAMRWEDGDWKFVIASTGDPGVGPLTDLTGFVPWSGVS